MGKNTRVIKITGGIGAGKSEVGEILKKKGETVIDADEVAAVFITAEDRAHAAEIFRDGEKLRAQENKIQPLVVAEIAKRVAAASCGKVFVLVPSLKYFAADIHYDYYIAVSAEREKRIERVMKRSRLARSEVEARMERQADDREIVESADAVIYNNGTKEELIEIVEETYNSLV